jgi:uncharacterized membrane protein YoaK (UPF0700 family)
LRHPATGSLPPLAGPLWLAGSLAAVAGCLDALSLARFTGTFVAFQSGNTVLFGVDVGRGELDRAWPTGVAVLTYILGSALTPFVIRAALPAGRRTVQARLFTWASVFLALDALIVLGGFGAGSERPSGVLLYAGIVAATIAMAMQTPIVRTVANVSVSTTFSSGMLVRLGQALGDLFRSGERERELPVTRILGVVNLCFLGGAVLGGVLLEAVENLAILGPALALPAIGLVTIRANRGGVEDE